MLRSVMAVLHSKEREIRQLRKELEEQKRQLKFKKVAINDMRYTKKILHKEIERLQNINNRE